MKNKTHCGIILKQRVLFEKDKVLTIFTQESGKISAFMKGARKITSRRNMHAELFNICRFQIYTTKAGKMLVQECTALRTFPVFREDFFRLSAASYAAEIMDRLTAEENPSEEKFILLAETLKMLSKPDSNVLLILAVFILKMLTLLGNLHNFSLLQKNPICELSKYELPPQETHRLFLETRRMLSRHVSRELVCEKFLTPQRLSSSPKSPPHTTATDERAHPAHRNQTNSPPAL